MQLPRNWHGFWVKKAGTTRYGKICWRFCPDHYNHSVEVPPLFEGYVGPRLFMDCTCEPMFWVLWYNDEAGRAKYANSASEERGSDLVLLPVEPEPWYRGAKGAS
jgi:hypothetical protein